MKKKSYGTETVCYHIKENNLLVVIFLQLKPFGMSQSFASLLPSIENDTHKGKTIADLRSMVK